MTPFDPPVPRREETQIRVAAASIGGRAGLHLILERGRALRVAEIMLASRRGAAPLLPETEGRLRTVLERLIGEGLVTARPPADGRRRPLFYAPAPAVYWYGAHREDPTLAPRRRPAP